MFTAPTFMYSSNKEDNNSDSSAASDEAHATMESIIKQINQAEQEQAMKKKRPSNANSNDKLQEAIHMRQMKQKAKNYQKEHNQ